MPSQHTIMRFLVGGGAGVFGVAIAVLTGDELAPLATSGHMQSRRRHQEPSVCRIVCCVESGDDKEQGWLNVEEGDRRYLCCSSRVLAARPVSTDHSLILVSYSALAYSLNQPILQRLSIVIEEGQKRRQKAVVWPEEV